jgi:hypothetical protein
MSNVLEAVPGKTDFDVAADLRSRLEPKLAEVAAILDEATASGFVISFNIAPSPPLNKNKATITIAKHF